MMNNQKEFILCAAIDFNGTIISGYRHRDCCNILTNLLNVPDEQIPDRSNQGFLTSMNRYVNRSEAFKIAKMNNQIWHNLFDDVTEGQLTSEDLYYYEN